MSPDTLARLNLSKFVSIDVESTGLNINKDKIITWNDVEFDSNDEIINYRHQMENKFRN